MSRLRWMVILALLLVLSGCGTRFIYNRLDTLARWELESYVSLSESQERFVRERLAAQLSWHRHTELPRYIAWMKELDTDLASGIDRAVLDKHFERFYEFRQTLAKHFLPDITTFLESLSDEQIQELFEALEEDNQDYADDYVNLPADRLLKKRMKSMTSTLRDWIGTLNDSERTLLTGWAREVLLASAEQLAYQRAWQKELREALAYRQDKERFAARMTTLFIEPETLRTPEFQTKVEHNIDRFRTFLVALHAGLTDKQRAKLHRQLNDYIEDFTALAARPD